ncbi:MAG: hypothetical protein K0U74_15370 [Alphaproteobacteria bacterium]|nr:hypothetical protein [Alphaproteobacteria bacterium]
MYKFVAVAALAAVAVSGLPTVSEAGHSRGHDCRLCKTVSKMRSRVAVRPVRAPIVRKSVPRDPLFKLAPRKPRAVRSYTRTRMTRPVFKRPVIKLPPRDPLFKLAPRKPRAVRSYTRTRMTRPVFKRPVFKKAPRDPLFKLAPRKPRPARVYTPRVRKPLFTRSSSRVR